MGLELPLQLALQNCGFRGCSSEKQATGGVQQDVLVILYVGDGVSIWQSVKLLHRMVHFPCKRSSYVLQADG